MDRKTSPYVSLSMYLANVLKEVCVKYIFVRTVIGTFLETFVKGVHIRKYQTQYLALYSVAISLFHTLREMPPLLIRSVTGVALPLPNPSTYNQIF